jgi:hypothetical protein
MQETLGHTSPAVLQRALAVAPQARWLRQVVGGGRCPIVDTWWQMETCGVC